METINKSIEVEAPLSAVYNQWTQFEEFPRFMEGVEEVQQVTDSLTRWRASIWGKEEEWEAEIYEQVPDRRIAWRSVGGAQHGGAVEFQPLGPTRTRVTLTLNYEPTGAIEKIGDALGIFSARVEGDLKRFREFIEERGRETGGWRGEIHHGQTTAK